jgi:hypothetical protein
MPPSRWITLLSLVCAVALAACGSERTGGPGGDLGTAMDGLCEARLLSARGLIRDAEAEFVDRAHAYLHRLARDKAETDREAVARLLEAKQRVEQAFAEPPEPEALAGLIEELRHRTAEAAGVAVPPCG